MHWAGQREQRRECVFLPVAFSPVSAYFPPQLFYAFRHCVFLQLLLCLWPSPQGLLHAMRCHRDTPGVVAVCMRLLHKGRNAGPLWSRPFTHSDLDIRTDLRGLQLRRKMYYPRLLGISSFQNVQRPPDLQPTPLRFLLFSPRLLRSQLSLTVIARMLGQQEAFPLWGEKTQVSLPQQDQEGLWWATTPLPHNLLTPEL